MRTRRILNPRQTIRQYPVTSAYVVLCIWVTALVTILELAMNR